MYNISHYHFKKKQKQLKIIYREHMMMQTDTKQNN